MKKTILAATAATLATLAACTSEGYDTGDGQLSYLTASLSMLHTGANKLVDAAELDNGTRLTLARPVAVAWATRPDTTYRALLYYDASADGTATCTARTAVQVPVLRPTPDAETAQMHTDPVGVEGVWMSRKGTLLNLSLLLKAGKTDASDAVQTLGVVSHGLSTGSDGKRTARIELYHDQGGVPEYYTVQRYFSVDTRDLGNPDIIELSIRTYRGGTQPQVFTVRRDG